MKKRILSTLLAVVMLLGMIIMPATAASGKMPFTDVKSGKWYYEAVKYVWENDLMNGVSEDKFAPDDPMNRAMLVTVLWRVEKSPAPKGTTPFTDLKAKWYKDAVAWAYENEVVNGMTATTFAPANPITREQIATIIYRYASFAGRDTSAKGDLSKFPDESKVAKYAKDAMIWAVGEGLITGTKVGDKDYLDPKGNATRAQVATILMRYLESGPKTLQEKIDIMLDKYLCVAHSRFDVVFNYAGSSFTEENFAALLRQAGRLGEEVQIEIEDFEDLQEEYGQGGDGGGNYGMLWPAGVTVIFTDTVTGEVVEEDIEFSIRKCLVLRDLYPNGVLGTCHEDADPDLVAAMSEMNKIASNDGAFVYGEFSGDYTADGIEAFFREYTGLTDADTYEFRLFNFDPSAPGTPFNAMFINKKAEDGKFDAVWNEFVFSGPDPMYAKIEDVIDSTYCTAHGKIDVYFGPSSTLTEANMNAFLTELFALGEGYTVEIDSDAFADIFGEYQGAGDGDGGWHDGIPVTFTNTATGETTTEEINLDIVKNLNAQWSGAMDNYALTYCWDDVPQIAKDAMDNLSELNDGEVLLEGDEYTPAVIEAYLRDKSGLTDAEEWQFFLGGFDAAQKYDGNEVCAAFKNVVDGRACIVGIGVTFKIKAPAVADPMHEAFEEFLDTYLCVTHGALTTMHKGGGNYNAANLAALVLDTMGLDADTYSVVINGDISDPGVGIGQFCGASNVEIYVKNNTTGEETEHQTINTSSRKLNHVVYDGTICLYTCPEDSEVWKPAEEILGGLRCSDGSHEDPIIHALFPDEASFTEENFVAAIAAAIEDVEGAEIQITKFEASRLNTDSTCRVYIYKWNDNVLEATDEISFLCSTADVDAPVLSAEHPAPAVVDPMHEAFEEFLDGYLCVTHGALTTMHKGGGNYNAANLAALVLDTMGLDADTYSVVINGDISDPGVGIGQFCGASNVEIYVKNNTTGEETEHQTINTSSRKLNHVEYDGTICLYTCPEDSVVWKPAEEILGGYICSDDSHEDPTIHALFPDEASITQDNLAAAVLAALEGIEGAEVGFSWFEDGYAGVYLTKWNENVLEATNVFEVVSSVADVDAPTISAEHPAAVDPMHAAFEEFLDEYLCVTHGALTTMHKGGSNYNAANLAALVLDTMGLDADTYSVVINGDISDPGIGIGQFCGASNVEIYVKNNTTGEETEHQTINTSSRKLNHVAYDGVICLYTCPEDSEMWKPAEEILGGYICSDDSHEDPTIHALFPDADSITQDNLAAAVLAALEGIEGAEVGFSWFEDGYAGVYLTKWNDNVLEATNVFEIVSSVADVDAPVLSAEHPVPVEPDTDPTPDNIGVAYEGETSGIKISYAKLFEENGADIPAAGGVGAHGGHETRIVRTENGTYATYITTATGEASEEHPLWFQGVATFSIIKITSEGFHVIFTDEFPQAAGSCTPNVINAGDGKVYVTIICDDKDRYMSTMGTDEFTNGVWLAVYEVDTVTDEVTAPEAPTLIDHETTPFQDHGYGYTQPILDKEHGKLYAVTCGGEAPGYLAWFIYDLETKTWDPECYTVELFTRRCYINGYPDGNGGFSIVIERCAPVSALTEATGFAFTQTSGYTWDALYLMHIADPTVEEVTVDTVIAEPNYTAEGYKSSGKNRVDNASHYGSQGCTYLDTDNNLHVIYTQGIGNEGKTYVYHDIYTLDGTQTYHKLLPTSLVPKNGGRPSYRGFAMTQGPDGTFYVIYLSGGTSSTTIDIWSSPATDGKTFSKVADISGHEIVMEDGSTPKVEKPIIGNSRNFSVRDGIIALMAHTGGNTDDRYYYFSIEVPGYEG